MVVEFLFKTESLAQQVSDYMVTREGKGELSQLDKSKDIAEEIFKEISEQSSIFKFLKGYVLLNESWLHKALEASNRKAIESLVEEHICLGQADAFAIIATAGVANTLSEESSILKMASARNAILNLKKIISGEYDWNDYTDVVRVKEDLEEIKNDISCILESGLAPDGFEELAVAFNLSYEMLLSRVNDREKKLQEGNNGDYVRWNHTFSFISSVLSNTPCTGILEAVSKGMLRVISLLSEEQIQLASASKGMLRAISLLSDEQIQLAFEHSKGISEFLCKDEVYVVKGQELFKTQDRDALNERSKSLINALKNKPSKNNEARFMTPSFVFYRPAL